ncbi:MAG: hypothetical protein EAX96_00850 [Candidatus Lokiarchaeota archaeon]|nr:hypothetical protein [Candidatus Lokiarchaeota archaeon]
MLFKYLKNKEPKIKIDIIIIKKIITIKNSNPLSMKFGIVINDAIKMLIVKSISPLMKVFFKVDLSKAKSIFISSLKEFINFYQLFAFKNFSF